MRALVLVAVAACSFPEKHRDGDGGVEDVMIDAATPFGCEGLPFQTTAPSVITIDGTAADLGTGVTANGEMVIGTRADQTESFRATTDSLGAFSVDVPTGGVAIDGFVQLAAGTYVPSFYYPGHPFVADSTIALPVLTMAELPIVGNPAGTALVQFLTGDCLGAPLAGCTIAMNPAPMKLEYSRGGVPTPSAPDTDANGYAIAYGEPAGSVEITGTCPGHPLRTTTISMVGDATYFVILQP